MPGADRVKAAPGLSAPQALPWSASGGSAVSTSAILSSVCCVSGKAAARACQKTSAGAKLF